MCVQVAMHTYVSVVLVEPKGVRSPGIGVTHSCELYDVCSGLWNSSRCS